MWELYNPNPRGRMNATDCAVRAVAKATGMSWESAYIWIALQGFIDGDVPDNNHIWGRHLARLGFRRYDMPDCPDCLTVAEFCRAVPEGTFIVGTMSHAVAVVDGVYYDAWDSGDEIADYVWMKGD